MSEFGLLLRQYRRQSNDPERGGLLTQARLAELLEHEVGVGYSPVSVSNWERDSTRIHKDDRHLLVGLIRVLFTGGGLNTLAEANTLLISGNYRSLNEAEIREINPDWLQEESSEETQPIVAHNLPPKPYHQLVGRTDELYHLVDMLRDPQSKQIISIEGLGGIGKTALALEAAEYALRTRLFERIVWISVRTPERFSREHSEPTSFSDYGFHNLLDEIGHQFNRSDIARMPLEQKETAVQNLLADERTLIVVDSLDAISAPEALLGQVRSVLGKGKLLITSRRAIKHETVLTIKLQGFPLDEGVLFLREEALKRNFPLLAEAEVSTLQRIYDVTGGAPLAMKLVIGQMAYLPMDVALQSIKSPSAKEMFDDLYKFIFQHSWELLDVDSQKLLISMSVFAPARGVDPSTIQAVSGLDASALKSAMDQLVAMSLVDTISASGKVRYAIHPLTHHFILSQVVRAWTK